LKFIYFVNLISKDSQGFRWFFTSSKISFSVSPLQILHYWARDFLAPIAIVALYERSTDSLNISLICDLLEVDTRELNVVANVYLWSQLLPRQSTTWEVTLRPNGVHYDKVIPISDLLKGQFTKTNSFLEFHLRRGHEVISRTYFFPSSITAAVGIEDPDLEVNKPCISQTPNLT